MSSSGVIESELDEIAGRLNVEHARLVDVAVELLADRSLWIDWECRSLEAFISWRAGVSHAVASKVVAVARRVDDLPLCAAAFREGLLSLDQIAPIARRVPWHADLEICRQAQLMTVAQISRTASTYPFLTDIPKPDGSEDGLTVGQDDEHSDDAPNDATGAEAGVDEAIDDEPNAAAADRPVVEADVVWFNTGTDGRFRLYADVSSDVGMVIESALTEARDSLFRHNGDALIDWADALNEVAQRSLDTVESPQRRSRFHTSVHVDTTGQTTDARGCGVEQRVADYLTCDGLRTEVHEVDGVPISVGRTQRIVPDRTRRTVIHRDGGCRVPGCDDHRWLDVHHIVHWTNNGPTDTNNLISLCGRHHRSHHRGHLGITGEADLPDGVRFTNRHGQEIRASGARPTPPGPRSPNEPTPQYTPAIRGRLDSWAQHFNLPDGHRHRWTEQQRAG